MNLFEYQAHQRRHGPGGYDLYQTYKPWLRDEFHFRCVYCLFRERWFPGGANHFGVDHIVPKSKAPHLRNEYDNLLYACARCNSLKNNLQLANPAGEPMGQHLEVTSAGIVRGKTAKGRILVDTLRLNRNDYVEWRRRFIGFAKAVQDGLIDNEKLAPELKSYFQFPDDLPDLRNLRPPTNGRPGGVDACYYALRESGRLPDFY